jgi:nitroimidazol reductase NimA-like FMN-containing flavoprotein (pyridoxamine 5'-phosphate oxidase superfamily)
MRRKDKEISDASGIKNIIEKATVCRLGMVNGDTPYVVPLCFGFQNNTLYFHSALKGQKIDYIRNNSKVCFEFDLIAEIEKSDEACSWGMKYQSVIGFGRALLVEDPGEKCKALEIIMAQYSDQQFQFPANKVKATAVIKVEIESMTGKQSHVPES